MTMQDPRPTLARMRTRLQTLLPSVLALTLVSLLVAPIAVLAQGAPAISMYPETAGPGSTIEITGIDFPPERVVEVQLATPDGTTPLTSATTGPEGDFRQILALPIGLTEGAWELQATAADGTTSRFAFATSPDAGVAAAAAAAAAAGPAVEGPATTSGNSSSDIALMLIIAVVLGGVAFGAMFVYRQLRADSPPGMGKGDDLIWGGGSPDNPAQTATDEPHWKSAETTQDTQPAAGES
jgi:hypothetical protein